MMNIYLDLLAHQGPSPTSLVIGGGSVAVAVTTLVIKHLSNRDMHVNKNELVSRGVCEERHKRTDETLLRIEIKLDKLLEGTHA